MSQNRAKREEKLRQSNALKRETYFALDELGRAGRLARTAGIALLVLIAANALPIGYDNAEYGTLLTRALFMLNVVSTFIFAIEYIQHRYVASGVLGFSSGRRSAQNSRIKRMLSPRYTRSWSSHSSPWA